MLVTLTATPAPDASTSLTDATDLGYLLAKHPDRAQTFDVSSGTAHVFYPECSPARTSVALLLEVDISGRGAAKGRRGAAGAGAEAFGLDQCVSDRPYVASSLLAVAIGKVFRSAMSGRCPGHEDLAAAAIDLEVHVPALPCRGGPDLARRVFAPLGWDVAAAAIPLDPAVPAWGDSDLVDLHLRGRLRVADALSHLYVLLPVLDDAKHYWVTIDEVDKLVRAGAGWLGDHPEQPLILARYLKHQRPLFTDAAARLAELDGIPSPDDAADGDEAAHAADAPSASPPLRRNAAADRLAVVLAALREAGASSVVDLGCGEGRLLEALLGDPRFTRLLGVEVSASELTRASKRLAMERRGDTERARIELIQGSVLYTDTRLSGYDAAVLSEVIEHIDPERLPALEHTVFAAARPATVVVTTPNADHNALFPSLPAGQVRHADHRFEWTRQEFGAWAQRVGAAHGYDAAFTGAGEDDAELGPSTQVAVLTRRP